MVGQVEVSATARNIGSIGFSEVAPANLRITF